MNSLILFSQNNNSLFDSINNKIFTTINSDAQFCRIEFFNDSLFCYTRHNYINLTDEDIENGHSYVTIGIWTKNEDTIILNTIYPSDKSILQILTGYLTFKDRKFIYNDQSLKDLITLDLLRIEYSRKLLGEKIKNQLFESNP